MVAAAVTEISTARLVGKEKETDLPLPLPPKQTCIFLRFMSVETRSEPVNRRYWWFEMRRVE